MKIIQLPIGEYNANCYVLTSSLSGTAVVIDPGRFCPELTEAIKGFKLTHILLTHGHFDHILGVAQLKEYTGAPVAIHEYDAPMLESAALSLARESGFFSQRPVKADILLHDGDTIRTGSTDISVIHTPGHTRGSVTFMTEGALFTGDTLFCLTYGRTDFPGGSDRDLVASIDRLMALEGDYTVYTGHNRSTLLSAERKHNRYLRLKNAINNR